MEIINIKVKDLKQAEYNPRQMTEKQAKDLEESITEFGLVDPIIVNNNKDRKNIIIGGHQRYNIAKKMGYEDIPCVYVDLPLEAEKELNLRLNKNLGSWDWDMLLNFDEEILLEVGFDNKEITNQFDLRIENKPDDDDVPEVPEEAKAKLGEIYQLGKHRIMCGDSTKLEDVEKLMDGKKADMVFTDPPYGVDYSGGTQFKKGGKVEKNHREKLINDNSPEIYDLSIPVMASYSDGAIYTWFGSSKAINIFQSVSKIGDIHSIIVWVKGGGSGDLNSNYKQKHEMCMYWKPKGGRLNFVGPNNEVNVWEIQKDGINKLHPTQKPIALAERAIKNSSKIENIILDLFLGSASTLIACEKTNRVCYGMELDPKYIDVIIERWEKYTGQKAKKVEK